VETQQNIIQWNYSGYSGIQRIQWNTEDTVEYSATVESPCYSGITVLQWNHRATVESPCYNKNTIKNK
jgi:hypothetical protein